MVSWDIYLLRPFLAQKQVLLPGRQRQRLQLFNKLPFLIRQFSISYHYSASLFVESMKKKKAPNMLFEPLHPNQILAMAAHYDTALVESKLSMRLPTYQRIRPLLNPLPAARKEVEVLSENFKGIFAMDEMASESNFKASASDFGIIHLAMHGLLDNQAPILSSLAFTEDFDSTENNFLQAYEISKLNLNAKLVVLSACETGLWKI